MMLSDFTFEKIMFMKENIYHLGNLELTVQEQIYNNILYYFFQI